MRLEAQLLNQRSDHIVSTNQLLVHELLDTHVAEFTPVTGVLDAAKRKFGIAPVDVVDEHHAGLHLGCDALATLHILGKDRTAQTEVRVIRQRNRSGFVLHAE